MLKSSNYRELKKKVLITECNEAMVEIGDEFLFFSPHPYLCKKAPYKDKSPFYLRKSVLERLQKSAQKLNELHPRYKLKIFDAYRPVRVQKFMIEYDTNRVALERYNTKYSLLDTEKQLIIKEIISHFWSPISDTIIFNPPPHSTGAALDLTIVDESGVALEMGTEIDELVDASASDFYFQTDTVYEKNRALLTQVMSYSGFTQLPTEWWHFSFGDQIWAANEMLQSKQKVNAMYGMV